jgi:hypothetical protein
MSSDGFDAFPKGCVDTGDVDGVKGRRLKSKVRRVPGDHRGCHKLSCEDTCFEGRVGEDGEALLSGEGKKIFFGSTLEEVVVELVANDARSRGTHRGNRRGLAELESAEIRHTDLANFALVDEAGQFSKAFFNGNESIRLVNLTKIDSIRPQARKARLDITAEGEGAAIASNPVPPARRVGGFKEDIAVIRVPSNADL